MQDCLKEKLHILLFGILFLFLFFQCFLIKAQAKDTYPPFSYSEDQLYQAICAYIDETESPKMLDSDFKIPCPVIIAIDNNQKDKIQVWGDYFCSAYKISDDTAIDIQTYTDSGKLTLQKEKDGSYQVIQSNFAANHTKSDGDNISDGTLEVFGNYKEHFQNIHGNEKLTQNARLLNLSYYARKNHLNLKYYQTDGDKEKIKLPNKEIKPYENAVKFSKVFSVLFILGSMSIMLAIGIFVAFHREKIY